MEFAEVMRYLESAVGAAVGYIQDLDYTISTVVYAALNFAFFYAPGTIFTARTRSSSQASGSSACSIRGIAITAV